MVKKISSLLLVLLLLCLASVPALAEHEPALLSEYWTEDSAAVDELISLFHQSSVLIQANPTKTEFYSMD